jgi:hypothetical protein
VRRVPTRGRLGRAELESNADPVQLAFELQALLVAANTSFILQGDRAVFERALAAIRERLRIAQPAAVQR